MFTMPSGLSADYSSQVGFRFHVIIGGNPLGEFRAVAGVGHTFESEEILEGGRNYSPHLRLGRGKYNQCRIEWGLSIRATLFDWIHAVDCGYGFKRLVNIFQLDTQNRVVRIYTLWDAWPINWEGANLDANSNELDTEEVTIAYEFMTLVALPAVPDVASDSQKSTWVAPDPVALSKSLDVKASDVLDAKPLWEGEAYIRVKPDDWTLWSGESTERATVALGFGEASDLTVPEAPPIVDAEPTDTVSAEPGAPDKQTPSSIEAGGTKSKDLTKGDGAYGDSTVEKTTGEPVSFVSATKAAEEREPGEQDTQTLTTLTMAGSTAVEASEFVAIRMSGGLSFARTVFQPLSPGSSDGE